MAHYKRRRRRKGGIKGHCHMCSLRSTDGTRNGRLLTPQEQSNLLKLEEGLTECKLSGHVSSRASRRRS